MDWNSRSVVRSVLNTFCHSAKSFWTILVKSEFEAEYSLATRDQNKRPNFEVEESAAGRAGVLNSLIKTLCLYPDTL